MVQGFFRHLGTNPFVTFSAGLSYDQIDWGNAENNQPKKEKPSPSQIRCPMRLKQRNRSRRSNPQARKPHQHRGQCRSCYRCREFRCCGRGRATPGRCGGGTRCRAWCTGIKARLRRSSISNLDPWFLPRICLRAIQSFHERKWRGPTRDGLRDRRASGREIFSLPLVTALSWIRRPPDSDLIE